MSSTGGNNKFHSHDGRICKPKSWKLTSKKAVHKKLRHHCDRKRSAMFSSQVVFPRDYVKARQAIGGTKQWGGAWWENTFSLQPLRPGGVCVCVCVENIEHLPVQNPPQNPDGARPMIRQTSKRPLVEDLSPISILHISWTWRWKRWLRVTGFHHSSSRTQWTGHRVMLSVPLV